MLYFYAPELIVARKTSEISKLYSNRLTSFGVSGSFPPKKSREIYQLIKDGDVKEISLVEWGALFRDSFFWQENVLPQELDDVVLTIFSEVEDNPELRTMVILNAVMTIEDSLNWLPQEIMSRFELLVHSLQGKDLLCFKLINSLREESYDDLADALIDAKSTPRELLDFLDWPRFFAMKECLESSMITSLSQRVIYEYEDLVERLFKQFASKNLVFLIDSYVDVVTGDSENSRLKLPNKHLEWLKENVGPTIENDIWSRIKPKTRGVLARTLDINSFPIYYRLIQELSQYCPELFDARLTSKGELGCHQRAVQRMAFWSNYTEAMTGSKLLLEPELHRVAKQKLPFTPLQALKPDKDVLLKTNWLVLEFELIIVAVQLTSSFSAIRIFKKSLLNESKLLKNNQLSTNEIILSVQDDLHDHNHLWQSSLEERLRIRYAIKPNTNVRRFEGINIEYTQGIGLKRPPQQQLNTRLSELERWEQSIIDFEFKLGKYKNKDDLDSLKELRLRSMLKNNQIEKAVTELRHYCASEKPWAYEVLSTYLLTKANGTASERNEGQKLYNKKITMLKK